MQPERGGPPAKLPGFAINALRYIAHEIESIAPALLFFLIGFLLVLLVIKLFLAQYAIGFSPFSEAVIGAIFAAKAVLVLDHRDYAKLRHFPRVYAVVCKTIIYVFAVLVFGVIERVINGYRETGSLGAGIRFFFHRVNRDRFFGTVLCVAIVFGAYFVIREVERTTGKGSMFELFFRRPARVNQSVFGAPDKKSAVG